VVAIGGPAITPPTDGFWQKVSGAVFLSKFSGGNPERYLPIGVVKEVDDWPSVNFMVRRHEFLQIGGFNSQYWPGEDTKLCLALTELYSKKILYVPELIVWHHRREGLGKHLIQVGAYGLHRGYFAKKYPKNSRKLKYFLPSTLFIFSLITLGLIGCERSFPLLLAIFWMPYFFSLIKSWHDIKNYEGVWVACCCIFYIPLTHLFYGYKFLVGFLTTNLKSRLR
jgi:GT2 family glycosyltransferase